MLDATLIIILVVALVAVFLAFWFGQRYGAAKKHSEWENDDAKTHIERFKS